MALYYGLAFALMALGVVHLVSASVRFYLIFRRTKAVERGGKRWYSIFFLLPLLFVGYIVIITLIFLNPRGFMENIVGSMVVMAVMSAITVLVVSTLRVLDTLLIKAHSESERSQKYLDISGIIVMAMDANADVTMINRKGCEILGYDEKDIVGKNWIDNFLPKDIRAEVKKVFDQVIAGNLEMSEFYTNPVLRSDGTIRLIEWHNAVARDGEGNITGTLTAGNDITERRAVLGELQESEERYRTLIENMVDIPYTHDLGGKILFVGPQVDRYGYSASELIGTKFQDVMHKEDVDDMIEKMTKMVKGEIDKAMKQARMVTKEGKWIWSEVASCPVRDEKNNIIAISGVLRDVSESRRIQMRLKEEKDRLQQIFDNLPIYGYMVSPAGEFISVNRTALHGLGYSLDEMLQMKVSELPAPHCKEKAQHLFERFRGGEVIFGEEIDIVTKNGEVRTVHVSASPIFDENGTLTHSIFVQRDITDWKKAQIEKMKTEKKYKELVDSVPIGIYKATPGPEGRVLEANQACMDIFEVESEEALQKYYVKDLYQKEEDRRVFSDKLMVTGIIENAEMKMQTLKGRPMWCRITAAVRREEGGNTYFYGMIADITKLKEAEIKVRELDMLKSRFITALTHIIRTPLNKIRWSLESLLSKEHGKLSREQDMFVRQAWSSEAEILRIIAHINTTLDIERGTLSLDKTPASLVSLVKSVRTQMESEHPTVEIEWTEKLPKSASPSCMVDVEKIRRVIAIIMDNSIHYPRKGERKLTVEITKKNSTLKCSVKDAGIGIPKAEQSYIFDRFFRASNAQVLYTDGMGLGLFIAKAIIDEHGGAIGFTSVEGKGSTFWFELPVG